MNKNDINKELKKYMKYKYSVNIEILDDGCYFVEHPELPGCWNDGKTIEEALKKLELVKYDYIKLLLERGIAVPKPKKQESTR